MNFDDVQYIKHPSTLLVAGPTQCGKTQFVKRLLKEKLFQPFPERLIWTFSEWQSAYDELRKLFPQMEFVKGLDESLYDSITPDKTNLIVLDDLMKEAGESPVLTALFTKGSHHRNLSVIYIVQNLFDKGKSHRSCSLNSHYIVLFKNPRDLSQINALGRQMFAGKKFSLTDALENATQVPHGYLLLDLRPNTQSNLRVRTSIFPDEHQCAYLPYG